MERVSDQIISGLMGSRNPFVNEERWVTMNGTHVLIGNDGEIKHEAIKKTISTKEDSNKGQEKHPISDTKAESTERVRQVAKLEDDVIKEVGIKDGEINAAKSLYRLGKRECIYYFGDEDGKKIYDIGTEYENALTDYLSLTRKMKNSESVSNSDINEYKKSSKKYYEINKKLVDTYNEIRKKSK